MRRLKVAVIALLALVAASVGAVAQTLDYGSMTNVANEFATGTTTSGNALIPVVVGVILFCAGIGVWYRFSAKARIRS